MFIMQKIQVLLFLVVCYGLQDTVHGQSVACPSVRTTSGWLDLFPLPCRKHAECRLMGTQHLCCKGYCTRGVKRAASSSRMNQPSGSVGVDSISKVINSSTSTTTSSTTTTTSTTTTRRLSSSAPPPPMPVTEKPRPFRTAATEPPQPFLQLLPIQTTQKPQKANKQATSSAQSNALAAPVPAKTSKTQKLVCPKAGRVPVVLFALPCENNGQCRSAAGAGHVCCDRRCVRGVPAPRPTSAPQTHQPILGVIPRECPTTPLGELLFEVQSCKTDADCWPRLCCPDGARSYCRTARARLDLVPIGNQIDGPVRSFEQYLQCTAPPQYDLFPKPCNSSVDCFPNLCCAEGGKKHCRPPQRSLIALLAGVSQRVGSSLSNVRQALANNNNKA